MRHLRVTAELVMPQGSSLLRSVGVYLTWSLRLGNSSTALGWTHAFHPEFSFFFEKGSHVIQAAEPCYIDNIGL